MNDTIKKYPDIEALLQDLQRRMQTIFDKKLVGLYLYGSLVAGDFDTGASDIDLLAVLDTDLTDEEFALLKTMHDSVAKDYPDWEDRIEVQYFSVLGLQIFRSQNTKMAVISPGEPFHLIQAGREWLMNWYFVQENGLTLVGPDPKTFISSITKEEFVTAVKVHAEGWREYIEKIDTRKGQAYAILTICRSFYTAKHAEQVSKKQAALWAQQALPEWAELLRNALLWREDWRNTTVDPQATFDQTKAFVNAVIDKIMIT